MKEHRRLPQKMSTNGMCKLWKEKGFVGNVGTTLNMMSILVIVRSIIAKRGIMTLVMSYWRW